MPAEVEHKLAAILSADIVGYCWIAPWRFRLAS